MNLIQKKLINLSKKRLSKNPLIKSMVMGKKKDDNFFLEML
jgi:hypothetical protein